MTTTKNTYTHTSLARSAALWIRPAHVTVIDATLHGVAARSVHDPDPPAESDSPCLLLAVLSSTRSARSRLSRTAPEASPPPPAAAAHETRWPARSDHLLVIVHMMQSGPFVVLIHVVLVGWRSREMFASGV